MSEKQKILVVEDNDFVRMQLCRFVQDEGYETVEAADGRQAMQAMSDKAIVLALVDVRMEPVDGFEFIRNIRAKSIKTPVILITGDDNLDILSESSKLGVTAVLKKPVQKERLIKILTRALHMEKQ